MDLRPDPTTPIPGPPDPWVSTSMPSRRDGPPFHMTEMIEAEPALAGRILARHSDPGGPAARLARAIHEAAIAGHPVVVTGCGTSEHAALAVAEILRDALRAVGLPSVPGTGGAPIALQAFEASLEEGFGVDGGLVIAVSHEGATAATNRALEAAREAEAATALITVCERSPGAALADIVVTTEELDTSWCHTVGYVSPILAAAAIAAHVEAAGRGEANEVDRATAADLMAAGLDAGNVAATETIAEALRDVDRLVVVGSGADRVAARELVLKVEEGVHLAAAMRDTETLLHGHLAGMDATTGVVIIIADRSAGARRATRARDVLAACREIGARPAAILSAAAAAEIPAELTPSGRIVVPDALALPAPVAALLGTAIPLQLLTERLARVRGVDPDPIRRDDPAYLRAAEVSAG